jgi:magnesium transporter
MSDHDETTPGSGFSTPVPELDDHRHQASSVIRPDRPRRGTFDSLYGARQLTPEPAVGNLVGNLVGSTTGIQDFEEAVEDDDADASPTVRRTRRQTVDSTYDHLRAVSPPNSVKAFAEARRQERELSFSEPNDIDYELRRAASHTSHFSHRSRHHTTADDTASLSTNKSAEEDVCFPLQGQRQGNKLNIDFDYLESFMEDEREAREEQRRELGARAFADLRPAPAEGSRMATNDGDFVEVPCSSSVHSEKTDDDDDESQPLKKVQSPQPDPSRVSFFSSAWESTIHASDMEGLILPGENIRGLFSFPEGETNGVWWLNINKPSPEEVRGVCRSFGIHPLTIEDITTQEAREKIELFPLYYFACFKSFYLDKDPETGEEEYMPFHVYVVVFREGVLSFSYANNGHASHVRQRITTLKDYLDLSSDWICYALM